MRLFVLLTSIAFFSLGCVREFAPASEPNTDFQNENRASMNQNTSEEIVPNANTNKETGNSTMVCLADVKQCPDGSFVPRLPPTCAFVPCPE